MLENVLLLLTGIAVFLIGMNMMSSGLKKSTGRGVKRLFKKTENNRFAGLGIGAAVTALIQSSAATSIMAIGFISAGVMTMFQGVSVILGAYIGTTVTGLIVSLSSIPISKYFVLLALLGVIMMFFKNEKIKNVGEILAGLGVLFFGLETLSSAFKSGSELTELGNVFKDLFTNIKSLSFNPIIFLVVGAILTALAQSSSATSGIVIVMVSSGALELESGFYLVLGATIGTVITTIIASIGGNNNVKKTAYLCLFVRTVCAILGLLITWIIESNGNGLSNLIINIFGENGLGLGLAIYLVLYNVIFMFALLPFLKPLIKLFDKLIKDKEEEKMKKALHHIDNRLLNTPDVAMMQVKKEIHDMFVLSYNNFKVGYNEVTRQNMDENKELNEVEDKIDYINNAITTYLINLSNKVSLKDEKKIGSYFHIINDIERIGDHASNFGEMANKMISSDLAFSKIAQEEFDSLYKIIIEMFDMSIHIFDYKDTTLLNKLHELEDRTDKLKVSLSAAHFERITNKTCHIELSPFYSTFVSELERVADHLVNIGYALVNPTGDDEEKLIKRGC